MVGDVVEELAPCCLAVTDGHSAPVPAAIMLSVAGGGSTTQYTVSAAPSSSASASAARSAASASGEPS